MSIFTSRYKYVYASGVMYTLFRNTTQNNTTQCNFSLFITFFIHPTWTIGGDHSASRYKYAYASGVMLQCSGIPLKTIPLNAIYFSLFIAFFIHPTWTMGGGNHSGIMHEKYLPPKISFPLKTKTITPKQELNLIYSKA